MIWNEADVMSVGIIILSIHLVTTGILKGGTKKNVININ